MKRKADTMRDLLVEAMLDLMADFKISVGDLLVRLEIRHGKVRPPCRR